MPTTNVSREEPPLRACKSQCSECPFRSTSMRGWLGNYDGAGGVFRSLWNQDPFFCHTRTDYSRRDWKEYSMEHGELCLGALIAVHRSKFPTRDYTPAMVRALETAVAMVTKHPEKFDVMEWKAFGKYHDESAFAKWQQAQYAPREP